MKRLKRFILKRRYKLNRSEVELYIGTSARG